MRKQYRHFCPNCDRGFHKRVGIWPRRCPNCKAALVLPSDRTGQCVGMRNFWAFSGQSWVFYEDFDAQVAEAVEKLVPPRRSDLSTKRIQ